jgi:hypothetical protein
VSAVERLTNDKRAEFGATTGLLTERLYPKDRSIAVIVAANTATNTIQPRIGTQPTWVVFYRLPFCGCELGHRRVAPTTATIGD